MLYVSRTGSLELPARQSRRDGQEVRDHIKSDGEDGSEALPAAHRRQRRAVLDPRVAETEVPSLNAFVELEARVMADSDAQAAMTGYHDLVERGRREIYKIEA